MKKILLAAVLISIFTLPAFAVCSITGGACSFDSSPSYDEYNPNIQGKSQRYDSNEYDSTLPQLQKDLNKRNNIIHETQDYDANCQFGICLPKKSIY